VIQPYRQTGSLVSITGNRGRNVCADYHHTDLRKTEEETEGKGDQWISRWLVWSFQHWLCTK